jgi:hypothetical protein
MAQPFYYENRPVDPAQIQETLKIFIDTAVADYLGNSTPSLTLSA